MAATRPREGLEPAQAAFADAADGALHHRREKMSDRIEMVDTAEDLELKPIVIVEPPRWYKRPA
jgi:hypothetical protein